MWFIKFLVVVIIILLINLPFGYWRANVKKFSVKWFLAVHLPVPFVALIRMQLGIDWNLRTLPILVISYFLGQALGAYIYGVWKKDLRKVGSNIFYDYLRYRRILS